MSKRDFEAVARVVRLFGGDKSRKATLAIELSREFAMLNPRFNKEKFIDACMSE